MARRSPSSTRRADDTQREALLRIMTGQDTDPFATMFAVYASTVTNMHEPVFTDIDFEVDVEGRRGRLRSRIMSRWSASRSATRSPARNRARRSCFPTGFEYDVADIGSASSRTTRAGAGRVQGQLRPVRQPPSQQPRGRPQLTTANPASTARADRRRSRAITLARRCASWWLAWPTSCRARGCPMAMAGMASPPIAIVAGDVVGDDGGDDASGRGPGDPALTRRCTGVRWHRSPLPRPRSSSPAISSAGCGFAVCCRSRCNSG